MAAELYPDVYDGEWITPVRRGYKWACCDCNLVHRFDFRIKNGRIEIRPRTDRRATAALRRWRGRRGGRKRG